MDPTRSREVPSCSAIDLAEIRRSSMTSLWIWSIISGVVGLRTYQHPGNTHGDLKEVSDPWHIDYFCVYTNSLPTVIYCIRQDLYNIIFQIKHNSYGLRVDNPPPHPLKNSGCTPGYSAHCLSQVPQWTDQGSECIVVSCSSRRINSASWCTLHTVTGCEYWVSDGG
jgi:hypothetical protein